MKTLKFSTLLIALASVFTFSSCLDSDNDDYGNRFRSYVTITGGSGFGYTFHDDVGCTLKPTAASIQAVLPGLATSNVKRAFVAFELVNDETTTQLLPGKTYDINLVQDYYANIPLPTYSTIRRNPNPATAEADTLITKNNGQINYVNENIWAINGYVNAEMTIVYDGKTADDIPSPQFSQLPAGTIEPYKSTPGSYYLTESGKRIATSASFLADGYGIEKNALLVKSVGTSKGKGFIKIKMDYKTSFNIRLVGNDYYTAWDGDYNLSSFTATHVAIVFENVTSVTKLPSFENNMVFSAGKWDTVTEDNGTKFRLLLTLRQPGVYTGHGAYYDSNDNFRRSYKYTQRYDRRNRPRSRLRQVCYNL